MTLEILPLQESILKRLSIAATEGKIDEVTRLSALAAKTKELHTAAERIQSDLAGILRDLADGPRAALNAIGAGLDDTLGTLRAGRGANSTIEVTIDWSKNGQPFGVETICDKLGSVTMAMVMERLTNILGHRVLEMASSLRVKRGPMISKNPQRDYWNASGGKPYGYRQIAGTGFAVLTGTESDQKVADVTTLLRTLGLAPGSFSVKKVAR